MTKSLSNVPLKDFKNFLSYHNLKMIRRTGSHEIWSKTELIRPVVVQSNVDPIPGFIVKSNLRSMGLTSKNLRDFLEGKVE